MFNFIKEILVIKVGVVHFFSGSKFPLTVAFFFLELSIIFCFNRLCQHTSGNLCIDYVYQKMFCFLPSFLAPRKKKRNTSEFSFSFWLVMYLLLLYSANYGRILDRFSVFFCSGAFRIILVEKIELGYYIN